MGGTYEERSETQGREGHDGCLRERERDSRLRMCDFNPDKIIISNVYKCVCLYISKLYAEKNSQQVSDTRLLHIFTNLLFV